MKTVKNILKKIRGGLITGILGLVMISILVGNSTINLFKKK
jgi:hypothetical protein